MPTPQGTESVSAPVASTDVTRQELPYRLRQQSLLGEFGRLDEGIGLPKDFDIDLPRASLGFKVIKSLLAQLEGRMTVSPDRPKGAAIELDVPISQD